MPLKEQALKLLHTMLGPQAVFRPGQWESIQSLLDGHHTLTVMPTGAGKSLIFQIAALQLNGITLVISPLIALMKDQVDSLTRRNIPATYINSALSASEQACRLENLAQGKYQIIYIAPERLRSVSFLKAIHSRKISLLAVDEAHCVSEWGHDFRPDYLHIVQARAALGNPLTAALTATATPQVQKDIISLLGLGDTSTRIVTGFNRPNLRLAVCYTHNLPDKLSALNKLLSARESGAVIVYTGTRRDAEEVAAFAREVIKIPAEFYHAGLPAPARTQIQEAFINGKVNLIAATNAFGMGIDRADVRHVIHYSLPGSLEAYYQEAGRAGRDGLPARATLLYDPHDRALQEFFIQQNELGREDLRVIHAVIQRGEAWLTLDDLSRTTSKHPVQLKVGLSVLERAGALEHLGDEGYRMLFRKGEWHPLEIDDAVSHNQQHLFQRQAQLNSMVKYAETNDCRRKTILNHFGDTGETESAICCDNCCENTGNRPDEVRSETHPNNSAALLDHAERAALVILDCIRRQKIKIGREKLAQILHGSKAQDILKFHHDQNTYYGKLSLIRQGDIENLIGQLLSLGYLKIIGGEYPVVSLTPRGENAIRKKESIALDEPKSLDENELRHAKARLDAGGTVEYTARLVRSGLTPEQIAHERSLARGTIYTHCERLIATGKLSLGQVLPVAKQTQIEAVIKQVGSVQAITSIKMLLPDEIDYGMIRCVIAARNLNSQPTTQAAAQDDQIESFLNRPHPGPLIGPWHCGWSLGFHSRFSGSDWLRSTVGDLTYRLKYQGDLNTLPVLVEQTLQVIAAHPELAQVDVISPVPPSQPRATDPVLAFCAALSDKIKLPVQTKIVKTRQTRPQKELKTLAQKRANVENAFTLSASAQGQRILLVDDLFDSGATLAEITQLLIEHGATRVNVLTLTRTIHSDA